MAVSGAQHIAQDSGCCAVERLQDKSTGIITRRRLMVLAQYAEKPPAGSAVNMQPSSAAARDICSRTDFSREA
ncbi:hypothetical protein TgHK011_000632 [Trichoderma gracile]|nr:hypothetical protein TgHK011_000632 [Trichoderma gracile]